jgi:hypothetical protein
MQVSPRWPAGPDSRVRITEGPPYVEMQMEDDFKLWKATHNNARM